MSFPKHLKAVRGDRTAVAPYNFVELPDKVVKAELECDGKLRPNDRYWGDRFTGKIECTLTTSSPLYTRCGLEPSDLPKFSELSTSIEDLEKLTPEEQNRRVDFFKHPGSLNPVLLGSSIRGMLRTLVEIVSFSKIERVADAQRLFFRAVGGNPKKDSAAGKYKFYVSPEKIQAGYLNKDNQGWYIQPAKTISGTTFAWVREKDANVPNLMPFNAPKYKPQYIPISYSSASEDRSDRAERVFASDVSVPEAYPKNQGVLVTSGHMKQGDERSPRCNHCLVFDVDSKAKKLRLDEVAIQHYFNALTDFQKDSPFNKNEGMLEKDRPVFYHLPYQKNLVKKKDPVIGFFGQSPNFRIPYSPKGNGHASTVLDFIPQALRDSSYIDIADAIFGYVRDTEQDSNKELSRRGRIFIDDATYISDKDGIWEESIVPQILGSPKPTTFQHYLVQPEETNADKAKLKHYANTPPVTDDSGKSETGETVIRGHKLYWHKGDVKLTQVKADPIKVNEAKSQHTQIKPIKSGVKFKFTINFENLTGVELGALMWVLKIAQDEQYRLSLGMGKPLGMGAVKIEHEFHLSNRQERYARLFNKDQDQWLTGDSTSPDEAEPHVSIFEEYVLAGIDEKDETSLEQVRRIKMLLAMLRWTDAPPYEQTRYMEIERDARKPDNIGKPKNGKVNEYAERPVLPTPLQIMGWETTVLNGNPESETSDQTSQPKPKKRDKINQAESSSSGGSDRPILRTNNSPSQSTKKRSPDGDNGGNAALQRSPKPPKRT